MLTKFTSVQLGAGVLPVVVAVIFVIAGALSVDHGRQAVTLDVRSCPVAVQKTIVRETFGGTVGGAAVEGDWPTGIFVVHALIDGNDYVIRVEGGGTLISKEIVKQPHSNPYPQSPRGLTP